MEIVNVIMETIHSLRRPFMVIGIGFLLGAIFYLITGLTESIFYPIIGIPMVLISFVILILDLEKEANKNVTRKK